MRFEMFRMSYLIVAEYNVAAMLLLSQYKVSEWRVLIVSTVSIYQNS